MARDRSPWSSLMTAAKEREVRSHNSQHRFILSRLVLPCELGPSSRTRVWSSMRPGSFQSRARVPGRKETPKSARRARPKARHPHVEELVGDGAAQFGPVEGRQPEELADLHSVKLSAVPKQRRMGGCSRRRCCPASTSRACSGTAPRACLAGTRFTRTCS
jgi:hypothetical protein